MIYGVLGDVDTSPKLVTAALDDQLEAHLQDDPDGDFWLVLGIRSPAPKVYDTIIGWAERNKIYYAVYTNIRLEKFEHAANEHHQRDNFMIEVVNRLLNEQDGDKMIYALLGDPASAAVDVRRALARALDNGIEVRDLSEAGLTVVGVADNPIQTKGSNDMADEETLTIEQAGEAADEGDDEAIEELSRLAEQFSLDPDEYPTWVALAEALAPLLAQAAVEEEEEGEAPARPATATKRLTQEQLEDTPVPELRVLAKQLGVEGWEKNRSAKLIEGILEAQDGGTTTSTQSMNSDTPHPRPYDDAPEGVLVTGESILPALARGLRAFADALEE